MVADRSRIDSLLNDVQRQSLPVQLLVPGASACEVSTLLAREAQPGELIFDAPRDFSGGLYRPGTILTAMTSHNGAELRFETEVLNAGTFEGFAALRTRWPDTVYYRQRRKTFRVRIDKNSNKRLELFDNDGRRVRGQLVDLSASGFGALIDRDASLQPGEELESLLELDGTTLLATVRLTAAQAAPKTRYMRVGAAFTELPPQAQGRLDKLIRAVERRAIREGDGDG